MRILALFFLALLWLTPSAFANDDAIYKSLQYGEKKHWLMAKRYAKASGKPELIALTQWRYLLDMNAGARYDEYISFIKQHPNWPYISTLEQRAEQALRDGPVDGKRLIERYRSKDPITGLGKIILAGELIKHGTDKSRIARLVQEGWVQGDFYADEEKIIRKRYAKWLNQKDDIARTDRLLWEKKTSAAGRMLTRVPRKYVPLFKTRIALIGHSRKASSLLRQVPKQFHSDAGLIFDRIRYRAKRKDDKGVRDMLFRAPKDAPYPEKWWPYRHTQARILINKRRYKSAEKILANTGKLDGADLAEALWLNGWLKLEFRNKPKEAYALFTHMYSSVGYPVSLARAAYWAGRAAQKMNNKSNARAWFHKAATHPTTFYGQLAALQLDGGTVINLPNNTASKSSPKNLLEKALLLTIQTGEYQLAEQLLSHAIKTAQSDSDVIRLAYMGYHEGVPHLSVRGSKKALQKHLICTKAGYPRHHETNDLPIEPALMHAIIRQESEFDHNAKSRAGARGMMQLMPGTARHTARKINAPYRRNKLYMADYNIMLGSHYLAMMLNSYDGSYVLAIAAYNAGPGNVNKWIKKFGRPARNAQDAINWIERIPFSETRNYVQRVMENIQVYRRLENDNSLELQQDLAR